jgi:hypothetical protein
MPVFDQPRQKVGHITFYEYELTEAGRNALADAK